MPDVETTYSAPAETKPPGRLRGLIRQLMAFGLVGGLAFLVDFVVYNLVRSTVLQDAPIWSKVVSVTVAMVVSWLGNRYLTFREGTRATGTAAMREGLLFAATNLGGLLIAAGCLAVSHYVLGFTSQLADNISGNVIGLVLGTAFRFTAYRALVFGDAAAARRRRLAAPFTRLARRTALTDRTRPTLPVKRTTTI